MATNSDVQLALLDLYKEELIRRIAVHFSHAVEFRRLIRKQKFEELYSLFAKDKFQFAEKLWEEIKESSLRQQFLSTVLIFLNKAGDQIMHERLLSLGDLSQSVPFQIILKNLPALLETMNSLVIAGEMSSADERYYNFFAPLRYIAHQKGNEEANREILRSLPDLGPDAYFGFLNALSVCGTDAKKLVEKMNPDFCRAYRNLVVERACKYLQGTTHMIDKQTTIGEAIGLSVSLNDSRRGVPKKSFRANGDADLDLSFVGLGTEAPVTMRKYQQELAERAYEGHNTIICAPTGSGKTIVAAAVVRRHLIGGLVKKENRKVCFFVTNTTFLQQQVNQFKRLLPHNSFKIIAMSGETNVNIPRRRAIVDADVVVITPQIIVNLLQFNAPEDGVEYEPFSLSIFTMLIFDEAHHTNVSHPYNVVMSYYHDMKITGKIPVGDRLPQVIGLTASLGIGDAKDEFEAVKYIKKICANLDCAVISRVRRYTAELRLFSAVPADERKLVEATHEETPFYQEVVRLIKKFEEVFFKCVNSNSELIDSIGTEEDKITNPPKEKNTCVYETWFSQLLTRVVPQLNFNRAVKRQLTECLQFISVLYRTLQISAHLPPKYAQKYLGDELSKLCKFATEASLELIKEFKASGAILNASSSRTVNMLFARLIAELHEEFLNKLDSRAIIFARTRDIVLKLRDAINEDELLQGMNVRAEFLTGINASKDIGGQNVKEQEEKLSKFASGEIKILCGTSVVDEGIDIQKCNLIIKYNNATNEIAHVQRRGRGRAEGSRCMLLTHDRAILQMEERNIIRERVMKAALNNIDRIPMEEFREQVKEEIKKMYDDRVLRRVIAEEHRLAMAGRKYDLLCKKCNVFMCSSDQIATDENKSQYFCVNTNFWKLVNYSEAKEASPGRIPHEHVGYQFCKCGQQWGRIVIYKDVILPVIAASAFVLRQKFCSDDQHQKNVAVKKWKNVLKDYFVPNVIDNCDVKAMKNAQFTPIFENRQHQW